MTEKCFSKQLAVQTSPKWMSAAHINGSEESDWFQTLIP
jgi:hypothetical protein